MPKIQRAKQFVPFDAVVGLRAALKEKEKFKETRKAVSDDLAEEINRKLKNLQEGEIITLVFYDEFEERYQQTTDKVTDINIKSKRLKIGESVILFNQIFEII